MAAHSWQAIWVEKHGRSKFKLSTLQGVEEEHPSPQNLRLISATRSSPLHVFKQKIVEKENYRTPSFFHNYIILFMKW